MISLASRNTISDRDVVAYRSTEKVRKVSRTAAWSKAWAIKPDLPILRSETRTVFLPFRILSVRTFVSNSRSQK